MIIGLTGYAQSGKDTVAETLVDACGYTRFAFADALKSMALAIDPWVEMPYHGFRRLAYVVQDLGWDAAKAYPDVRLFLQHLGCAARDELYDRVWIDVVGETIEARRTRDVVITDVRFANEAKWVGERGKLVRVVRPGVGPVNGHRSESELDNAKVDLTIFNAGSLDDLAKAAIGMVGEFSGVATVTGLTEYRAKKYAERRA